MSCNSEIWENFALDDLWWPRFWPHIKMTCVLSLELVNTYRVFFSLVDALRIFRVSRGSHMCPRIWIDECEHSSSIGVQHRVKLNEKCVILGQNDYSHLWNHAIVVGKYVIQRRKDLNIKCFIARIYEDFRTERMAASMESDSTYIKFERKWEPLIQFFQGIIPRQWRDIDSFRFRERIRRFLISGSGGARREACIHVCSDQFVLFFFFFCWRRRGGANGVEAARLVNQTGRTKCKVQNII